MTTVDLLALLGLWGPCPPPCAADFEISHRVRSSPARLNRVDLIRPREIAAAKRPPSDPMIARCVSPLAETSTLI